MLFHGYDNGDGDTGRDCAPYGTGEARARDFGLPGDVTYRIEEAFRMGRRYLAQYKYFGDIAFVGEAQGTSIARARGAIRRQRSVSSRSRQLTPPPPRRARRAPQTRTTWRSWYASPAGSGPAIAARPPHARRRRR